MKDFDHDNVLNLIGKFKYISMQSRVVEHKKTVLSVVQFSIKLDIIVPVKSFLLTPCIVHVVFSCYLYVYQRKKLYCVSRSD